MDQPEADLFQSLVHNAFMPHRDSLIALDRALQLQAYHNTETKNAAIEYQQQVEALIELGFELGFFTLDGA